LWGNPYEVHLPPVSSLAQSISASSLAIRPFSAPQRAKVITQATAAKSAITFPSFIQSAVFPHSSSTSISVSLKKSSFCLNVDDSRSKTRDTCSRPRPLAYATNQWQTRLAAHDHYKRRRIPTDDSSTVNCESSSLIDPD